MEIETLKELQKQINAIDQTLRKEIESERGKIYRRLRRKLKTGDRIDYDGEGGKILIERHHETHVWVVRDYGIHTHINRPELVTVP